MIISRENIMSRRLWKKFAFTLMIILGCSAILSTWNLPTYDLTTREEIRAKQLMIEAENTREYQLASLDAVNSTNVQLWHANLTHPKFVLLHSYMRSGSSFVGDIFHNTPDVFYIYEPLDPLYSAMYGTADGWTIPADIFFYPDGTQRSIPQMEVDAVAWTLETIFTCHIASWPSAMLRHTFWQAWVYKMHDIGPYNKCLRSKNITGKTGSNKMCSKHIASVCGGRFNAAKRQNSLCRDILWNEGKWFSTEYEIAQKLDKFAYNISPIYSQRTLYNVFKKPRDELIQQFVEYFKCHRLLEEPLKECARTSFDKVCQEKAIRVVKTVRAASSSAGRLWENYPNFKLVHLFRDPRGYARSKLKSNWAQGLFEKKDAKKQAIAYCKRVLSNELTAFNLTRHPQHRNKRLTLIYDEVASNPVTSVEQLFQFIQEPSVPKRTMQWLRNNTVNMLKEQTRTNSTRLAYKWMDVFTFRQVKEINNGCKGFLQAILYPWIL